MQRRKFLQHSGPMVLSSYLLNNKEVNLISAISQSQTDYYKFKRSFVSAMDDLGFDGTSVQIVDKILEKLKKGQAFTKSEEIDLKNLPVTYLICYLNLFHEAIDKLHEAKPFLRTYSEELYQLHKEGMGILRKIKYS